MLLGEVCAYLNNFFLTHREQDIHIGAFPISGGSIEPVDFLKEGQYYRIVGSALNDGVYQYTAEPNTDLRDEDFSGSVWAMSPPPALIALVGEIETWIAENASAISSPYQSESFGGYSYSKGADSTWQGQFASRLSIYRKVRPL